jgi:hypothetical protein
VDALRRAPGEAGQARAVPDPAQTATHAAPDQVPIDRSATRAALDRVLIAGAQIHAVLDRPPIDRSVIHAALDRAPTVGAPIHAALDQAPVDRSVIHAVVDRVPIVGDPIRAALDQAPVDRSVIHAVRDRVPIVGDPIHAALDQAPIGGALIRAVLGRVPIGEVPTLGASHRPVTAQAVILAAAIPVRRGLQPVPDDPPLLAVDVRSLAPGARDLAPTALALIARNLLAAVRPLIPVLQHLSRNSRSLILTSRSSMPRSGNPLFQSESPMRSLIHISMSLTLLKKDRIMEKGRILISKCPRLVAPNSARVGPGLLAVAAPLVARMLKASAFKRCYRAQGSRRAARLRIGFARAASPSTANLPCSAPACRPPTNCASTAASFVNARQVAALQHSLCTVRQAKV